VPQNGKKKGVGGMLPRECASGLPDGLFLDQKLGQSWRVMQWKMLEYFIDIWTVLRLFGLVYGHLENLGKFGAFFPVLVCCIEKNLATLLCIIKVSLGSC
jgi:hypothetical protein